MSQSCSTGETSGPIYSLGLKIQRKQEWRGEGNKRGEERERERDRKIVIGQLRDKP